MDSKIAALMEIWRASIGVFLAIANESIECRPTVHGLREAIAEVLKSINHPAGATAQSFMSEYPSLS